MTNRNQGIIYILVAGICGAGMFKNASLFISSLSVVMNQGMEPEATAVVCGFSAALIVSIVCLIYGMRLATRPEKKSDNK
jgi:hypothetical protein